jgi:hypothetical protein
MLYAPPLYADRVIEIRTGAAEVLEIGPVVGAGEAKYACGAVAFNGKIYCPPYEARKVMEINCEDHEVNFIGKDIGSGGEKYSSIAASPAGIKLFAAPREARNVLEIDPVLYMVKEIGKDMGSIARKFTCIVPGLTHKELKEAQKLSLYHAQKALEIAERRQALALRDMTFATEMHVIADGKVKTWSALFSETEIEVAEAEELMKVAEASKSLGAAQASYWIECRENVIDAQMKLARMEERKRTALKDLESKQEELDKKAAWLKKMNSNVETAKTERDLANKNSKKAVQLEIEARRQAAEAEEEREKARKY